MSQQTKPRTIRIAYCTQSLHHAGGMERVITTKANYLAELGYQVYIITTDQGEQRPYFPLSPQVQISDLGINYEQIDPSLRIRKYYNIARHKALHHKRLEQKLFELKCDIVISTGYEEFAFLHKIQDGSIKLRELHCSWANIVSEHRFSPRNYIRRLMAIYAEWDFIRTATHYQAIALLTQEDEGLWAGRLSRTFVIPNIIPIRSEELAQLETKRCIVVARFSHEKNVREILCIWALVADKHPDWHLDLYGGGYLHEALTQQAIELGISKSCTLHDATTEIKARYLESSILLMTSHTEGLPMALLEAQELGIPAICYSFHCGPKDVLLDGNAPSGIIVPYGDQTAFAQQLGRLMEDEALRKELGRNARANARRFHPETILPKWDALFRKLLSKN